MNWKNPKKRSGRFINPHIEDLKRSLWDFFLWHLGFYDESKVQTSPPAHFFYPAIPGPYDRNLPGAVWIGHSTYLIQVDGLVFLTDPIFSLHCSPVPLRALKRQHEPSLSIAQLPPVDFVLISHNHYDHLDKKSVSEIARRHPGVTWVVPKGVKDWFLKQGHQSVRELDWGESCQFGSSCRITAVPAQHFSGRGLRDKNRTLWCGYVVECREKVFYFVGDTGYNPIDFKRIGERWPSIDLSLIPIGTYIPKRFMQSVHISPQEAVQIHCDVKSKLSLGMHWKTFLLSDEPADLPPYDLFLSMQDHGLAFETFLPVQPGVHVNW